jgi:hypothetical protein
MRKNERFPAEKRFYARCDVRCSRCKVESFCEGISSGEGIRRNVQRRFCFLLSSSEESLSSLLELDDNIIRGFLRGLSAA